MGIHRVGLTLCLVACGKATNPTPPAPEPAPWSERAAAYEADLEAHRQDGWLVVRTEGGYRDEGDSLSWSGEAMGVSCAQAEETTAALERMQDKTGGYYQRVDPLPQRYQDEHNVVSRDGWIGVIYGMTRAWRRCPELQGRMAASWLRARAAVGDSNFLAPNSSALITPSFRYLMDRMTDFAGEHAPPPRSAAAVFYELATEATAHGIVADKSACYPLHLAFSAFVALTAMGSPVSVDARHDLCEVTKSTGLMNWAWYCQNSSAEVASWLEQYQTNKIVYAHQRCSWEQEDFAAGDSAASLDWLTLRDLYINGG